MTKTAFKKAIKGMFNDTRHIEGVHIARVCWRRVSWLIVENEDTWDDIRSDNFTPIEQYETGEDLYNAIYKTIYNA